MWDSLLNWEIVGMFQNPYDGMITEEMKAEELALMKETQEDVRRMKQQAKVSQRHINHDKFIVTYQYYSKSDIFGCSIVFSK